MNQPHTGAVTSTHGASEPHRRGVGQRLNWLRAGVLGANDGIVSIAGLVVGVAAATTDRATVLAAGLAGLIAGATSMALGEYVSVSTQRDTERALLAKEHDELTRFPDAELKELADLYVAKGATRATAEQLAKELTACDAFAAHVDIELGIDPERLTNPWHAAGSSAASFVAGAALPIAAISIAGASVRILVTVLAVVAALAATGFVSATLGGARRVPAVVRLSVGGGLAMGLSYVVGQLIGTSGL